MSLRPGRIPTVALVGAMVATTLLMVGIAALVAAARGNHDITPALLGGIGQGGRGSPPAPGASVASGSRASVVLPAGWSVEQSDDERLLLAGPHAVLELIDRDVDPGSSAASLADDALAGYQRRYPDARRCREAHAATVDNGPSGIAYALCFTDTSGVGRAVPADAVIVEAVESSPGGGRHLLSERIIYRDDDAADATSEVSPVVRSIQWRRDTGAR